MSTFADVLWRVNNEYHKRLTKAQTYIDLLEQLLLTHDGEYTETEEYILASLRYTYEQVARLVEEHRGWRYTFYYESIENKRMVQEERDINRALANFNRMQNRHERHVQDLSSALYNVPRPDPIVTQVPGGDLWVMMEYALNELAAFGDFVNEIAQS